MTQAFERKIPFIHFDLPRLLSGSMRAVALCLNRVICSYQRGGCVIRNQ